MRVYIPKGLSRGSNSRAGEDDLTATLASARRAFLLHGHSAVWSLLAEGLIPEPLEFKRQ